MNKVEAHKVTQPHPVVCAERKFIGGNYNPGYTANPDVPIYDTDFDPDIENLDEEDDEGS